MRYYSVLFFLVLTACSGGKEEVVSLDQISPSSEKNKNRKEQNSAPLEVNERPTKSVLLPLIDGLSKDAFWKKWDTLLFPDRFGAANSEKWLVKTSEDSLTVIYYEFKDSLRTKNAFFNWIDCFGPSRKAFKIGGNVKVPSRNVLIYVGEKNLTVIESTNLLDEAIIRTLLCEKQEKQNWLYLVNAPRKGKTAWKRIEKGIEKPIVRVDENS
jgi:hypothetical protein